MTKPFSMSRFCSIWHCECEYEVDGNLVYLFEPLHYTEEITEKDKPHWGDEKVTFYREQQKDWIHVNRHLMFSRFGGVSPDVVMLPRFPNARLQSGLIVEVTGGQVIWREERWFVRWQGYTHTRAAKLVRAGIEWWKNPDREMPERLD
jgi:hypothetical protein